MGMNTQRQIVRPELHPDYLPHFSRALFFISAKMGRVVSKKQGLGLILEHYIQLMEDSNEKEKPI